MHHRRLTLIAMLAVAGVGLTAQDAARRERSQEGAAMGFVRYASGETIVDVRVTLIVPGDRVPRTTRTGADGSYRFEAVPAGEYQLSASVAGAVAKRIQVTPGAALRDLDFSIPDGGSRRVVTGRVVMNEASRDQPLPARVGVGIVLRRDGTVVLPLPPGDHRVFVRLPQGYFVDSASHGSETVYSMASDGKRLSSATFSITVPPEPQPIPDLVLTLGVFRSNRP